MITHTSTVWVTAFHFCKDGKKQVQYEIEIWAGGIIIYFCPYSQLSQKAFKGWKTFLCVCAEEEENSWEKTEAEVWAARRADEGHERERVGSDARQDPLLQQSCCLTHGRKSEGNKGGGRKWALLSAHAAQVLACGVAECALYVPACLACACCHTGFSINYFSCLWSLLLLWNFVPY